MTNTERKQLIRRIDDAKESYRIAFGYELDPGQHVSGVLAAWSDRVEYLEAQLAQLGPRTMTVAITMTIEVDLDAYELEYGTGDSQADIRQQIKTGAASAFDGGVVFASDDIAKVVRSR